MSEAKIKALKNRFWEVLPGSIGDYSIAINDLLEIVGELSLERLKQFVDALDDYDADNN